MSEEYVPPKVWTWDQPSGGAYADAATFLSMHEYENVGRWIAEIDARPGARRGLLVNREEDGIAERHSAADFDNLPQATL